MQTTLLSSKGQVIIPKAVRAARNWGPGTRLTVHETAEGVLLTPAAPAGKIAVHEGLAGIRKRVGYQGRVVSLQDMDVVVLREAARRGPGRKPR